MNGSSAGRYLAAGVLLLVLSGGGPARAGDPPGARRADLPRRVDAAIERGIAWLRRARSPDGGFPEAPLFRGGVPALAYHAMRVCRVPADDPACRGAFQAVREAWREVGPDAKTGRTDLTTYTAALFCIALAEHGEPSSAPGADGECRYALDEASTAWMKELVKYLEDIQDSRGRWSYGYDGRRDPGSYYDNSTSQFALLGLKAASRSGVRAKAETWTKALKHFVENQGTTGKAVPRGKGGPVNRARSWGYGVDRDPSISMTAGGAGSLVICRSELLGQKSYDKALDRKAEQAVRDGIAWLGLEMVDSYLFDVDIQRGSGSSIWDYYACYAIERAGALAGLDRMGAVDWYGTGAEFLLAMQGRDGSWGADRPLDPKHAGDAPEKPHEVVASTCFALLFLARGTLPVGRGSLTPAIADTDIDFDGAAALSAKDFEDFLDVVLARWRKSPEAGERDRLFAKATAVGPRILPPLLARLASETEEVRSPASALLKRSTGLDMGYDPGAGPEARKGAAARWQAWWTEVGATLAYDAGKGLIAVPGK